MASDSDVEAYLNQLSKKTHRLKQDSRPWEESLSSPSDTDRPPLDDLSVTSDPSFREEFRETKSKKKPEAATSGGGVISDIAALSEKYSFSKGKKSAGKDRFSKLEEKYLKKPSVNATLKSPDVSKQAKQRRNSTLTQADTDTATGITSTKVDVPSASKEKKTHHQTSSEELDENLADYLNEMTLASEKKDSDKDNQSDNSEYSDSMDEVINLKNVINVEDVLGEETDGGDSVHLAPTKHNSERNVGETRRHSQQENRFTSDSQRDPLKTTKNEQNEPVMGANLLLASKSSLFYSSRHKKEEEEEDVGEEEDHPPVQLLLAQTGGDVFLSSRRKSSIEFKISENIIKPQSSKQSQKRGMKGRHKPGKEDSIASASESHISEQVPWSGQSRENTAPSVASEETEEPSVASQLEENEEDSQMSSSADTGRNEGRKSPVNPPQTSQDSDGSLGKKAHKKNSKKAPSAKGHKNHSKKVRSSKGQHSVCESKRRHKQKYDYDHRERRGHKPTHDRQKDTKKTSRKSKKKHRSPSTSSSSSSSSSSPSSSSSLSSSDSSKSSCTTSKSVHRKSRSHRKSRRATHSHWGEPPSARHSICPCCCFHTGHAAAAHTQPAHTGGGSGLSGGVLGMGEVMQQQVALVRQFLDSQQLMYQAYTSTLISSHHYTSLRRTEKYMKRRKPPLTFPEAYKLVKEEMEASER